MTARPLFIGIDFGTSGCRAVAVDGEKNTLASARQPLPPPRRQDGRIEQDAELWWQALTALLADLSAQIRAADIAALSLDGTSGTVLVTDATGQPLAPALMYNDASSQAQMEELARLAPADTPSRGLSGGLARALQLFQRHPEAKHALNQADWLLGRLAGSYEFSDENNVLKMGYDVVARCWPGWLDEIGLLPLLPGRVLAPGSVAANIDPEQARALGLPVTLKLVAGTTDSNAATLAAGISEIGEAVTSLGSTLVLKVLSERPVFAAEYGVYSHRLGDKWLVGGASNSGGAVLAQHFSREEMAELTAQLRPDEPTGLDYYPLPETGERFPFNDPRLPPRLTPVAEDRRIFFQAMLEGMAGIEKQGYERLAELGAPYPSHVISSGGGAANEPWRRIRQNLLGIPVSRAEEEEAAYGSALLALAGWQNQKDDKTHA